MLSDLSQILANFTMSDSLMLLEFLIRIFCRESIHVHEDAIQAALAKFTKRSGISNVKYVYPEYGTSSAKMEK